MRSGSFSESDWILKNCVIRVGIHISVMFFKREMFLTVKGGL